MKNIFTLLFIFTLSIYAYSQEFANRKIISGGASLSTSIGEDNSVFSGSISILYGKIKEDNTYLAYGGRIGYSDQNNGFNFLIGPSIEKGKFVKLTNNLYLNPVFGGNANVNVFGDDEDDFGLGLGLYFSPLRFAYSITNNLMISARFGSASFNANYVNDVFNMNLSASLDNDTGIGAFYTFK